MGNENSSEDEPALAIGENYGSADSHMQPLRVSFDMSALEEGRFPAIVINKYEKPLRNLGEDRSRPIRWVNISELVKKNSFVAVDKEDVYSLVLTDETVDHVGDFPYQWDASDIDVFDSLFRFIAENDFQLVTIDKEPESTLSIYVIRSNVH